MARVELWIELEDPEKEYRPRERVRGTVKVTVEKATEVNCLEVFFTLRAVSRHATATVPGTRRVNLFTGSWEPGTYEYEFDFPGPRWPQTYKHVLIDWQWLVTANADLHMAIDVEDHAPLTMRIPPEDGLVVTHRNPGNRKAVAGSLATPFVLTAVFGAMTAAGLAFDIEPLYTPGIGFGIIALLYLLYCWMKVSDVGAPQLFVTMVDEPEPALDCELLVKPTAKVERVDATLWIYERKKVGGTSSDSGSKTYETTVLEQPFALERAEPGVYRGRLVLPAAQEVPYTVEVMGSSIGWQIKSVIHMEHNTAYPGPAGVLWALPARGDAAGVGS